MCPNKHLFQFLVFVKTHALLSSVGHAATLWIVRSGIAIHQSTDDRLFSVLAAIPSPQSRSLHIVHIYTAICCFYSSSFDLLWVLYLIIFLLSGSMFAGGILPSFLSDRSIGAKHQYAWSSRMSRVLQVVLSCFS